ncbi:MAG: hypothetical protein GYB65_23115 [Chloroflexi bacterium]|nr:hypothetical protein [Chloroflexota bacterium]
MKRLFFVLIFVLWMLLFLVACSDDGDAPSDAAIDATVRARVDMELTQISRDAPSDPVLVQHTQVPVSPAERHDR